MRKGAVNRVLTGFAGLLLLVVGGSVLAVGLGAPAPSWWPHTGSHDVLLTRAERTRWRDAGWWWPAVLGALAVLVLLALGWLTAVLRRRRLTEIPVDTGDGDFARLRAGALASALAVEAGGQEGVARAEVLLARGRRAAPVARARLQLDPDADPATALTDFTTGALAHARESAGLAALPAEVRLSGVKHRPERVS